MKFGEVSWIYQARRVATQANVGGGSVVVDISLASGQIARLIAANVGNSGTNGITITMADEDNARETTIAVIASGAATSCNLPSIGAAATTSGNVCNSTGLIIPSGAKLTFVQGGAGAQNDTFTIGLVLELFNVKTEPTWDKSRSTNAADVTLAANTISAANTLTTGRIWA